MYKTEFAPRSWSATNASIVPSGERTPDAPNSVGNETLAPSSALNRRGVAAGARSHARHKIRLAATAASATATTAHLTGLCHRGRWRIATGDAGAIAGASVDPFSRRKRATAMSEIRALRSFSRQPFTSVRTCGGTSAGSARQSGSPRTTAAIVSVRSSPSKARFPVSIS